ncbi:MAG: DUF5916 domain-containing protein [Gemmatimonadales bacterium]|nr:DUF5916 domain-containing protein [Gemmatimonadales bacterium]
MPGPEVRAVPVQEPIRIDGRLDEALWQTAPIAHGFRQSEPREGEPATQRTEVRFAFDDAAIYVGARMYDDSGSRGVRTRLVRRDADPSSDYLQVIFDTYHDHLGRLFFLINPSGVKNDENGLGGGGDASWDPVWDVETTIDSLGWTAEMRIPFSQLRFPSTREEQTWGLQIWRQVSRLNELSQWSFWGRQETGGAPRFGHLRGLVIRDTPSKGEVLPYVVARSANAPGDALDPFYDPHVLDGRFGADATVLVTSNLTLNATVNPDFGQVEVDPAVVNLSAFETFFGEKRPFFSEGAGYFGLGGLNCFFCSNVSSLSMLSTRRIGRQPQMPALRNGTDAFADTPDNTTILGAAKLTGRTPSGWSIGVLDAVTRRERATVERTDGSRYGVTVEPFSNYFAARVAKDLRGGATQLKAMATSVIRDLDDPFIADRLSRHAEVLGVSADMWWKQRRYRLMAQVAGSQVSGDPDAILRFQRSSARFFQRPDREHGSNGFLTDSLDPTLTSMRGLGAYARLSRESGRLLWEISGNVRTPGFDNNDITFFSRADYAWMSANVLPQWTKPTSWYRQLFLIVGGQQQYNFDGDLTDRQTQLWGQIQTLNYWRISGFWIHRPNLMDDRLTRGGPVVRRPGIDFFSTNISTDSRKKLVFSGGIERGCNVEGDCDRFLFLNAEIRPRPNVSLSIGPSIGHEEVGFQFVDFYDDTTANLFYDRRYVFARLEQNSISMNTRFNVTFSPRLTLELFLQPLIASGEFSRYNEYAAPRTMRRLEYGTDLGTMTVATDPTGGRDTITVDADGGGPAVPFSFVDPSFTLRSLRGNAVLRWEYRPGSTLFLVWTRSGASELTRGRIELGDDTSALFRGPSENIFLVKVNYWLGF